MIIENEEINSMKYVFTKRNDMLELLINDENSNGKIKLFEKCTKQGFFALENYYFDGSIDINENNCFDILMICCCYNEEELLKECKNYLFNNICDDILNKILIDDIIINHNNCEDIKNEIEKYIIKNGNEILQNESINIIFI